MRERDDFDDARRHGRIGDDVNAAECLKALAANQGRAESTRHTPCEGQYVQEDVNVSGVFEYGPCVRPMSCGGRSE